MKHVAFECDVIFGLDSGIPTDPLFEEFSGGGELLQPHPFAMAIAS